MAKVTGAPALDAYLHQSYELIQYVADNMPAVKAVASHLTPVEDLLDFQLTITELHAKLALLVEASELIIRASPIGIQILLAPDAVAERLILGLGSAALKTEGYFAKTADFDALSTYVAEIKLITDQLTEDMSKRITRAELTTAVAGLQTQIDAGGNSSGVNGRIDQILIDLAAGQYTDLVNSWIVDLSAQLSIANGLITGQAQATLTLGNRVTVTEQGVTLNASHIVELNTQISNTQTQMTGQASAVNALTTQTSDLLGVVTAQAQDLTVLSAQAVDLASQITAQSDATQSLSVMASNTAGAQATTASFVTQLSGRIVNAESGIALQAEATDALTTSLLATKDELVATASSVTALQVAIIGTGNLIPNSTFNLSTGAWKLFSRGAGWLAAELALNLEPERLPQAINVLSLTATGVPSGVAGIRSSGIPVTAQSHYILSGYLAAENCTLQMEWRLYDGAGLQVGFGIVGNVTNVAPSTDVNAWTRVHEFVPIPIGGATLELQLWVSACNTASPKAWMLRPMVEESIGSQTLPSPWSSGTQGMEQVIGTAFNELATRVTSNEDGLLAQSHNLTQLQSLLGNIVEWRVVTIAGSGNAASVGAPLEPSLRVAQAELAAHTFTRGLTLVRFTNGGLIASATAFDTYASVNERDNLTAAMDALGDGESFLLVSENNHGIKNAALTTALERCGAHDFATVAGGTPYALRGRGGLGKGNGIEVLPAGSDQFIDFTFTTVNAAPQGVGGPDSLAAVATAVNLLNTRVASSEAAVDALASSNVTLAASVETATAALISTMITQANKFGVLTSQINNMDTRLANAETGLNSAASTVSGYESRLSSVESDTSAVASTVANQGSSLSSLTNTVASQGGTLSSLNTLVGQQAASLSSLDSVLTSQASNLTTLTSNLVTTDAQVNLNKTTITSQTASLNAMQNSITNTNNNLSATNSTATALASTVLTQGNAIASQGSAITSLNSGLTAANSAISANATATNSLSSRVVTAEGNITANTADLVALTANLATANGAISANGTAVSGLGTSVSSINGTLTSQGNSITSLQSTVNNATTGVTATANAVSGLSTQVTDAEGTLVAHTNSLTSLNAAVGANQASITNESNLRASADSANASSINAVSATANSKNRTYYQASAPAGAVTGDIWVDPTDNNRMRRLEGSSWLEIADYRIGATATALTALTASVDATTGKLNAAHTLELDVNGKVVGWKFQNDGTVGDFAIRADKFSIYPASPSGARTEFSDGNWRIYDSAGVLRVRLGVWQ